MRVDKGPLEVECWRYRVTEVWSTKSEARAHTGEHLALLDAQAGSTLPMEYQETAVRRHPDSYE